MFLKYMQPEIGKDPKPPECNKSQKIEITKQVAVP